VEALWLSVRLAFCVAAILLVLGMPLAYWRIFREILLPLSLRGVITAAVLSFAHTLGEFGVVLMVGGNIPGVTRTVSIDIYDRAQSLDYSGANRMAVALLSISFAVLSTVYALNRRVWSPWPSK